MPDLLVALQAEGYALYGPQVRDGAIVIDRLQDAAALPRGWASEQEGGTYRLHRREDDAVFGYVHGADSWKKLLHPAHLRLWSARREGGGFVVQADDDPPEPFALIGVRGCDLRAIAIQDRVFLDGEHVDAVYQARRRNAFIIGVDCGEPGGTCFCTSMGTGPAAGPGYDLALTELGAAEGEAQHRFVVRVGSARGQAIIDRLRSAGGRRPRTQRRHRRRRCRARENAPRDAGECARCAARQSRKFALGRGGEALPDLWQLHDGVPHLLLHNRRGQHRSHWRHRRTVAALGQLLHLRILLRGRRHRAQVGAGSRYRHWISHKLATWHDQFGESGCVGCGRCITWCPVAIDITAEVAALAENGGKT